MKSYPTNITFQHNICIKSQKQRDFSTGFVFTLYLLFVDFSSNNGTMSNCKMFCRASVLFGTAEKRVFGLEKRKRRKKSEIKRHKFCRLNVLLWFSYFRFPCICTMFFSWLFGNSGFVASIHCVFVSREEKKYGFCLNATIFDGLVPWTLFVYRYPVNNWERLCYRWI